MRTLLSCLSIICLHLYWLKAGVMLAWPRLAQVLSSEMVLTLMSSDTHLPHALPVKGRYTDTLRGKSPKLMHALSNNTIFTHIHHIKMHIRCKGVREWWALCSCRLWRNGCLFSSHPLLSLKDAALPSCTDPRSIFPICLSLSVLQHSLLFQGKRNLCLGL